MASNMTISPSLTFARRTRTSTWPNAHPVRFRAAYNCIPSRGLFRRTRVSKAACSRWWSPRAGGISKKQRIEMPVGPDVQRQQGQPQKEGNEGATHRDFS